MNGADAERMPATPRWLVVAGDWRLQLALAAVALALAIAVGWAAGRRPLRRVAVPAEARLMPEAFPIADAWRAAAAGDEKAYLACFAGEALGEAQARLARVGPDGFRQELRKAAEAATGIAWGPPVRTGHGSLVFPVTVSRAAGEERFRYTVMRMGTEWRIARIEPRGGEAGPPAPRGDRE